MPIIFFISELICWENLTFTPKTLNKGRTHCVGPTWKKSESGEWVIDAPCVHGWIRSKGMSGPVSCACPGSIALAIPRPNGNSITIPTMDDFKNAFPSEEEFAKVTCHIWLGGEQRGKKCHSIRLSCFASRNHSFDSYRLKARPLILSG